MWWDKSEENNFLRHILGWFLKKVYSKKMFDFSFLCQKNDLFEIYRVYPSCVCVWGGVCRGEGYGVSNNRPTSFEPPL